MSWKPLFNCWNVKEASHDRLFSPLQLLEFEGRIARQLRFHIFHFWISKDASHESFVFTNHGCDLNVRTSKKHCVFSGKWSFCCGEKLACLCDGFGRRRLSVEMFSSCTRSGTDGSRMFQVLFLFFDDALLLCIACIETLCALELLH